MRGGSGPCRCVTACGGGRPGTDGRRPGRRQPTGGRPDRALAGGGAQESRRPGIYGKWRGRINEGTRGLGVRSPQTRGGSAGLITGSVSRLGANDTTLRFSVLMRREALFGPADARTWLKCVSLPVTGLGKFEAPRSSSQRACVSILLEPNGYGRLRMARNPGHKACLIQGSLIPLHHAESESAGARQGITCAGRYPR
jgi:hypothetical protein